MRKLLLLILLAAVPFSIAMAGPYYCYNQFQTGRGIFMWLISLAVFAAIIYFVFISIRRNGAGNTDGTPDAMSILKSRLAKGEISEEQYDRLMEKIS